MAKGEGKVTITHEKWDKGALERGMKTNDKTKLSTTLGGVNERCASGRCWRAFVVGRAGLDMVARVQ